MSKITFDYTKGQGNIGTCVDIRGKIVSNVSLSAGQAIINHSLGYIPNGYIILKLSANVTVWESASADRKNIYLTASGSATATVLVI